MRACLKIPWESCLGALGPMARREEGGYPQRSLTNEQQSQRAQGAKTLRAAVVLAGGRVGSAVTARCGADKSLRNKAGATALDSVAGPFEEVRGVYDLVAAALGPLGLQLDYEGIRATRPKIAERLR